jgi:adenosylmethionine-8-amino-7-oxononanoate aminotransferase
MSIIRHPFTQHALEPRLRRIVRAEGAYLTTDDGRRILDAISSWWVITHGHPPPAHSRGDPGGVRAARSDHLRRVHAEPAERLAVKLLAVAPAGLTHVFFSDSGSSSVEVAIKIARSATGDSMPSHARA